MRKKTRTKRKVRAETSGRRAIWQGSISFGLVDIPVALHAAEQTHDLDLTLLDQRDFSPVGNRRYNKTTGEEVSWNEVVRGYEYEKGQFVVLSDEDLRRANPELTREIHIERFVHRAEIDPLLFERPYYLAPLRKKSRGYALLRETLERTGTVGIANIAIRTREHVAMLDVRKPVLVLHLLRYPGEVRDPSDIEGLSDVKSLRVTPQEVQMATRIVESMTEPWKPGEYTDEYKDDLLRLVKQKIASGKTHEAAQPEREAPAPARASNVIDLMPLLRKSLESSRKPAPTRKVHHRRKSA